MSDYDSDADGSDELVAQQSDGDFEYDYEDAGDEEPGQAEMKQHDADEDEMIGSTIVKPICLCKDEMVEALVAEVQDIAQTLDVSFVSAAKILRSRHWDRVRVFEEFTDGGAAKLLEGAKQQEDIVFKTRSGTDPILCIICCDEMQPSEMISTGCAHYYCNNCWGHYLTELIDTSEVFRLVCMDPKCGSPCGDDLIQLVVSDDTFDKYRTFMGKKFIDEHPYIFWCPSPGCDRVVRVPNLSETGVQCSCGFQFCIKCSKEAHAPCTCATMDKWTEKSGDDGLTANWIIANTKSCPKCTKPIEKNGGCNHMTCSQCRHEFCWLCMGDWRDHRACNTYKPSDRVDTAKATLERYLFYWQRYNSHLQSQKLENKILTEATAQMEAIFEHTGTHETGYYLLEAAEVLIACRRALKYTYVHAYYMKDKQEKSLFEFLQQQLEYNTEVLSRLLSTPGVDKTTVVNQTAAAKRRLDNLLEGAKEGLLSMKDADEWAKWQEALGIDEEQKLESWMIPPPPREVDAATFVRTHKTELLPPPVVVTAVASGVANEDNNLALAIERSLLER